MYAPYELKWIAECLFPELEQLSTQNTQIAQDTYMGPSAPLPPVLVFQTIISGVRPPPVCASVRSGRSLYPEDVNGIA